MKAPQAGWSGDLHEVTWFTIQTPIWEWFWFGRVNKEGPEKCWFLKIGYWGLHVSYTKD